MLLPDSNVWIDHVRQSTPLSVKRMVKPFIIDESACIAEPIVFEILRGAAAHETKLLERQFANYLVLPTPSSLWNDAAQLGRHLRTPGITIGGMDLLIASVAISAEAKLITFDADFAAISRFSKLQVEVLKRSAF